MQERSADYYLEGDLEGWDCAFSGAYEAEIVAEYLDLDGLDVTGNVRFSPLDSLAPWVSSCDYTPPKSGISLGEATAQPAAAAGSFHIPIVATPLQSYEFEISGGGNVLTITVRLPASSGDICRIYTYTRTN